jgi:hypothetical protein
MRLARIRAAARLDPHMSTEMRILLIVLAIVATVALCLLVDENSNRKD